MEERRDRADRKQRQRVARRATKLPRPLTKSPTVLMRAYRRLYGLIPRLARTSPVLAGLGDDWQVARNVSINTAK